MKLVSTNPANNYSKVGEVDVSTDSEIKEKVVLAHKSKQAWKELGVEGRIKLLKPIRDEFYSRVDEIAKLISTETGKVITEATSEVNRYITNDIDWFLGNGPRALSDEITLEDDESLHRIVYEPYGVAASIAPWNYPFGMAVWGIFPNLVAGNCVIFKTSEECILVGKLIEEIMFNHDLPDGVFAMVHGAGDVGEKLSQSDINLLWFTGSTRTGKKLYRTAGNKFIRAVMEMGGSSPCVVFEDIDVPQAASIIYSGRFQHCGQVCTSLKRLIVHESIVDKLTDELKTILLSKKVGDPLSPQTDHGSLVAKRQVELLESQLQDALDKGGKIVAQAKVPASLKGAFFPPTLITNITKDMRVWTEEVFGPVLPIVAFKDEGQAIRMANDTIYGLGARVISEDEERAERVASKIDAGSISLNYENRFLPVNPFGGYKSSGIGRERGLVGLRELSQIKVIQKNKSATSA
jgi:succinate-semialdehyde dehydrogenase/glutarate-semialdehyde dehydrogenase